MEDSSEDDESYNESSQSDISLGSNDTDINQEEVGDIVEDAATMPTPKRSTIADKKASLSSTKKKGKTSDNPILQLAEQLAKTKIENGNVFTYRCPKVMFTCRDGNRDAAVLEFHAPLPKQYLRHCKVLDGGTSLSILFGYPKVFSSERCHKKLLATQGIAYDTNSGHVLACSSQVTHFVMSNYDEGADKIDGEPQVCKLPFKCPEGYVASEDMIWLNWPTDRYIPYKGSEHKQFLTIMAIKLNSVATYAVQRGKHQEVVLSDSESESEDHQNNDDGEMLP